MSVSEDILRAVRGIDDGWSLPELRQYLLYINERVNRLSSQSALCHPRPTCAPGIRASTSSQPSPPPAAAAQSAHNNSNACGPALQPAASLPVASRPALPPTAPLPPDTAVPQGQVVLSHCSAQFEGWDDTWQTVNCQILSRDPNSRWLGWHSGMHPTLLAQTLQAEEFPAILREVVAIIQGMLDETETKIMFHCRGGRHRSLSCLWLCQQCLLQEGFDVQTVSRDSKHPHDHTDCDACIGSLSEDDFQALLDLWQQLTY